VRILTLDTSLYKDRFRGGYWLLELIITHTQWNTYTQAEPSTMPIQYTISQLWTRQEGREGREGRERIKERDYIRLKERELGYPPISKNPCPKA